MRLLSVFPIVSIFFVSAPLLAEENKSNFFNTINYELKMLDPKTDNSQSDQSTLALAYDFDYAFTGGKQLSDRTQESLKLSGRGLIAFDKAVNPKDFLETKLDWGLKRDVANPRHCGAGTAAEMAACKIAQQDEFKNGCVTEGVMTSVECDAISKAKIEEKNISSYFAYLDAKYESNQDFSQSQLAYGINGGFSSRSDSLLASLLDTPFKLTRRLSNHPLGNEVYPGILPTVLLAVEQVAPQENEERQKITGGDKEFERASIDIGMTSIVGRVKGKDLNFNFFWRYFKEIDPDKAIKDAGLHRYRLSSYALVYNGVVSVSYTSGKLPFDKENQRVFDLGLKFNFD